MCGIAGYVDFSAREISTQILDRMASTISHRGPDASGLHTFSNCGLAHTRLSIIDLSHSHQPFCTADDSFGLTYNGELYNYKELKNSLHNEFDTSGDTEVLLRCLTRSGTDALRTFEGMYAFGLWDEREQQLLLARDPLGKKPLFYAQPRPDLLIFGSEIKSVLAHPEVPTELNESSLRKALRFRAVYGEETLYRGVRQVTPGSWIEFNRRGTAHGFHYQVANSLTSAHNPAERDEKSLIEHGFNLMRKAVEKRLIADVPVGAFLSGGIDSSLIVAMMSEIRGGKSPTHTFSVGFEDDASSELPYASEVARHLGTRHTEVTVSTNDYVRDLATVTAFRDAPMSEPADLAIYQMSRVAKEQVKVVLSGEGSDEVFCGYPKYALSRVPPRIRSIVSFIGADRLAHMIGLLGLDSRRSIVAARALAQVNEVDHLVQWFSYFSQSDLANILPGLGWTDDQWVETVSTQEDALRSISATDPAVRMQIVDLLSWLPGNLLERGDRMTMAAGLEARVPFLDPFVVDYGLRLPRRMKIRGRTLKWVVRQWAASMIPRSIIDRPKWGFRVPLDRWMRGDLKEYLVDELTSRDGICSKFGNPQVIRQLLTEHDSGQRDHQLALWGLFATEIWYRHVFRSQAETSNLSA